MNFSRAPAINALILVLVYSAGCSTAGHKSADSRLPEPRRTESLVNSAMVGSLPSDNADVQRLAEIWAKRSKEKSRSDFPIGAGDVVEISVPAMEELRSRTVRISGDGSISLPFVGRVDAAGLTEEELKERLALRLKQFMHNPRVIVFVKEYRSRQVAVLGSVMKPGVYGISTAGDTLLDMISMAGGIAPAADPKIYFIPAEAADGSAALQIASTLPANLLQQDPAPLILKRTEPILIDINQLSFGGNQQYLSLQVRPGDVIMVPGGGQVLVEGWVEKPGAYPVTTGLTAAGAVVAAGGHLYPADTKAVRVIRPARGGNKTVMIADLDKIKQGDAPDIVLQSGDIVDVVAQTSRLVPYGFYRFFSSVVNVGLGANIPLAR